MNLPMDSFAAVSTDFPMEVAADSFDFPMEVATVSSSILVPPFSAFDFPLDVAAEFPMEVASDSSDFPTYGGRNCVF